MQFFADLVSALTRLAGDDVNISQEISNLQAAEAKFESDVQAQTLASINAQVGPAVTAALAAAGVTSDAFTALAARVTAIEQDEAAADANIPPAPPAPPAPLVISTTSLADAVVGTPYTASIATTGGTGNVTLDVTGLPAGLVSDASGNITGTATGAPGPSTVSVSATDSATPPVNVTSTLTLTVDAAAA